MNNPILLLRENQAKHAARVKRLRSQLEAAELELSETETAIRVLERIGGIESALVGEGASGDTSALILQHVGFGETEGKSPKEIFEELQKAGHTELNADLVRTQLWRMANRKHTLMSGNGRYWRHPEERSEPRNVEAPGAQAPRAVNSSGPADGSQGSASHLSPEGSIPSGSTPVRKGGFGSAFTDDLDSDVPF